jgi:hypothetical protein
MSLQVELWNELDNPTCTELLGSFLKREFESEQVRRIDFSYVGGHVNQWWLKSDKTLLNELNHSSLKEIVLKNVRSEDLAVIKNIGRAHKNISAVLLEHVFSFQDKKLAKLVHEVMAEIAGITDIKYPYEDHKELFPKASDKLSADWGKGLGIIRPHSDDLYEGREINAMCLTVCKDISSTPTWFWMIKDLAACLTDEELGILAVSEATYFSGANVEGKIIEVRKPILRKDISEGFGLRLDFRIDDNVGPRMRPIDSKGQEIFQKLRTHLRYLKPLSSNPSTGSVSILANYKVLHGRSAMNPAMLYEGESSRILFRSKGMMEVQSC